MSVTAQDMAKPQSDTPYYAIKENDPSSSTTGGIYSTDKKDLTIATVSVSNITSQEQISCKTSVQVTLTGDMVGLLKEGDMVLNISDFVSGANDIDLSKDKENQGYFNVTGGDGAKTATATFTGNVTLKGDSESKTVTANLQLINKAVVGDSESESDGGYQNYIAGKSLTATFKTLVSECAVSKTAD